MPHASFLQVVVYQYPESGNCEDCEFSEHIESDQTFRFQNYMCQAGCVNNTGTFCPVKEIKVTG